MTNRDGDGTTQAIDVTALFDAARRPCEETDRAVVEALERHGNFVAVAAWPGLDRRAAELFAFFAMDEHAKASCATNTYRPANPNIYRGFYPAADGEARSKREIFDIGPEPPATAPDLPGADAFRESNAWPDAEPWDGWCDAMTTMLVIQRGIAMTILAAVSRGLDLEEDALFVPAQGRNATLRLLHSAVESAGAGDTVITGSHVDTGILSMIWQDHTGGLQMQGPDGTWRDTPIVTDGLSVHCGDLVKTPSGGRIRGTPHQVMRTDDPERCSMGFFLEPDFETRVAPPSGVAVSYARHLVNEFPDRFKRPANAA